LTQEESRLQETRKGTSNWKKWGPYLSERQWGTVREDYSESGDAWNFFTHPLARLPLGRGRHRRHFQACTGVWTLKLSVFVSKG
jgi:hypothetical protein